MTDKEIEKEFEEWWDDPVVKRVPFDRHNYDHHCTKEGYLAGRRKGMDAFNHYRTQYDNQVYRSMELADRVKELEDGIETFREWIIEHGSGWDIPDEIYLPFKKLIK